MNILFVTGQFPSSEKTYLGGMPKAVYKNAKGMKARGHQVRILTVDSGARKWKYKGIPVSSVKALNGIDENCIGTVCSILNREIQLQKEIKRLNCEEPIDMIQYAGWFGVGLLHLTKIPAVMRISSYTKVQLDSVYKGAKGKCLNLLEKAAVRRMNAVFAPSRVMAEGVSKDTGRKVWVLETPYEAEELITDTRIWEKGLKGKKYFLFFGRLSKDKGIYVIKNCLHDILAEYPEMYFVFAGASDKTIPIERELKKAAGDFSKRVLCLGSLAPAELQPVVSNAEVVIMPSLMDNFPNACAEAMAMGKIVIGTDGSSLEQFITHGDNGYLAQIGDSNSLFEQVRQVMNLTEEKKISISMRAKERINKLSPARYFDKLEMLYNKLCK